MDKQQFDTAVENIFRRSMTDSEFRTLALTDAAAAFKAASGHDLPAGFKVRFVENNPGEATLVLPSAAAPAGELSDDALESVAGGTYFQDIIHGCQKTCRASAGSNSTTLCGPDVVH